MATCPKCRTRYEAGEDACPADGATLLPDEAFSSADRDLEVGDTVGEYRVEGKLGEGSYGTVYRGVHPVIGKTAALKVLKRQYSANPEMVSRFISEARAVNQIRHKNIIDIFAFGVLADGRHYYVMEALEGRTLDDLVKERGRLSPEEAMPIFRQLGRALGAAHAAGILHRDIKPENVFVTFDDEGQVVPKLLDFGIAKLAASDENRHKTRSGTPMGTPLYMSPEQIRGGTIDHRADVYSFGILVHEVLTGEIPFDGNSVIDVLMKHTTAQAPSMSSMCADVPAALDAPVLHMLEKDPDQRPASIGEAVSALLVAAGMPAPPPSHAGSGSFARSSGARSLPPPKDPAQAKTVAGPEAGRTLRGSSVGGSAPPPSKRSLIPVVAIAAIAAVAVTFVATRGRDARSGASPDAPAAPSVAPVGSAPPPLAETAAPSVAPSTSAAPVSSTITVTINATPPGVEIWNGDRKLSSSDLPLVLPRAEGTTEITLKKNGFVTKTQSVPTHESSTLNVDLIALPTAPKKPKQPGGGGDLEF